MRLIVRPEAARDLNEAFLWYEAQRLGLGDEFLLEIESAFNNIQTNPTDYRVIYRDTRRALVRRFPFCVFFRISGETIVIVACLHGRRHPKQWKTRT